MDIKEKELYLKLINTIDSLRHEIHSVKNENSVLRKEILRLGSVQLSTQKNVNELFKTINRISRNIKGF